VASDPIVIPGGRLRLISLEDVPSQRDGVLMFIGTEVKDRESVSEQDVIPVRIGDVTKRFRRLKEGDWVEQDQLLAQVDDTLARADEAIKIAKVAAAKADKIASEKTRDEAKERYATQEKLWGSGRGGMRATTAEDLRGALLQYNRYFEETVSKEEAIKVAEQELNQALATKAMYEIRPKISGVVKVINKHTGEAVKALEAVLQIQNYKHLRVDALLQEQYANHLEQGMKVSIEPTFRESPNQTLVGHRDVITGVAVSKDRQKPFIVSCSDDHTVRVWELSPQEGRFREIAARKHAAPIRAIACTPVGASANLCVCGDEQGKGFVWDLDHRNNPPLELKGQHLAPILCVAFSPDGRLCATGGEDREIMVWDTSSGALRYQLSGHRNAVTALYFAPGSRLISVGRDPAVRFWKLGEERAEALENETIQRRDQSVDNLGVSSDGRSMMDDHGGEMRIISTADATTEAILRNTTLTALGKSFANFALFSPDGRLALTTPKEGGVVQLWHIDKNRSYELRQFVAPVRWAAKSAAFAPDGSFVVAAINDRLYVWQMPSKEEAEPIWATITNIEKPIEAVENQVKVTAEFENPGQRLRSGDVVTMVAYPKK
jgi:multidrug efflux pump subunit AcrA (membrane-fusion protein)